MNTKSNITSVTNNKLDVEIILAFKAMKSPFLNNCPKYEFLHIWPNIRVNMQETMRITMSHARQTAHQRLKAKLN